MRLSRDPFCFGSAEHTETFLCSEQLQAVMMSRDPYLNRSLSLVMEIVSEPRDSRITVGELAKQFSLRTPDKDHRRDVTDCPVSRPVDGKEVRFPTLRSWAAFLACRPFWRNLRENDAVDFPPPNVEGAAISDVFSVD